MMNANRHDENWLENEETESATQFNATARALEQHGVDLTGAESGTDLTMMKSAVDEFRRAAERLAGQVPVSGQADDLCRKVVPPRAADETPRQYSERVNRMSERFRALVDGTSRESPL
jgi:hypothetical protein